MCLEVVRSGMDVWIETILGSHHREHIKIIGALAQTCKWMKAQTTASNKRKRYNPESAISMYEVMKRHIRPLKVKNTRRLVFKLAYRLLTRNEFVMDQRDPAPPAAISTSARLLRDVFTMKRTVRSHTDVFYFGVFGGGWLPIWSNDKKVAKAVTQLMFVCRSRYEVMRVSFVRYGRLVEGKIKEQGGNERGLKAVLAAVFKYGPSICQLRNGTFCFHIDAVRYLQARPAVLDRKDPNLNGNMWGWERFVADMLHAVFRNVFGSTKNYCLYVRRIPDGVKQPRGGYICYCSNGNQIMRRVTQEYSTVLRIADRTTQNHQMWFISFHGRQPAVYISHKDDRVQATANELVRLPRLDELLPNKM